MHQFISKTIPLLPPPESVLTYTTMKGQTNDKEFDAKGDIHLSVYERFPQGYVKLY
jgi:hypothetical protein